MDSCNDNHPNIEFVNCGLIDDSFIKVEPHFNNKEMCATASTAVLFKDDRMCPAKEELAHFPVPEGYAPSISYESTCDSHSIKTEHDSGDETNSNCNEDYLREGHSDTTTSMVTKMPFSIKTEIDSSMEEEEPAMDDLFVKEELCLDSLKNERFDKTEEQERRLQCNTDSTIHNKNMTLTIVERLANMPEESSKSRGEKEKRFNCNICNKSFSQKPSVNAHMRTHTGEKPFHCNICNNSFSVKSYLDIHVRTHTGEKPFQCDICNKSFVQKSQLSMHIKTHTGEKPFECDICKTSFARKSHLSIHIRTHTRETPFQCDICNNFFSHKSVLSLHIRTHTGEKPFQCDICNKSFSRKSYLSIHNRTHTGEKPFQCDICKNSFARKTYLNKHIQTHTGEKPFQCDICKKSYTCKFNLDKHIQNHR